MRNNQPVTQKNIQFPKGRVIISHTDLKGRITLVNDAFVAISGYTREELLGQPHNLLRHPDMPTEAFRDLWATVKAGRPWSGLVKNRCKNGDHYWVRANVTPLPDGSGFMSVRTEASPLEISSAQGLYERMQRGAAIRLRDGEVTSAGLGGRISGALRHLRLGLRLWLAFGLSSGLMAAGAGLALAEHSTAVGVAWIVGAFIAGFVVFSLTLASMLRSLSRTREMVHEIATSGNLASPLRIGRYDEVGQIITEIAIMRSKIHELVGDLVDRIGNVGPAASTLAGNATMAAQQAGLQAKSATAMASAIEQMSVSVEQIRDHASESRNVSEQSSQLAVEGGEVIMRAADEIGAIASAVQTAVNAVRELEGHSAKISNIVQVIRDIADQTNLLALNAAIEAARAGEQGRGFAVVADEVRKLAERTSTSTVEIANMVQMIQSGTEEVAHGMEASVNRVTDGVELARQAGGAVDEIRQSVSSSTNAIAGIFDALQEQATATHEIAKRVEEIAQSAERGSSSAEDASSAARMMHSLAGDLEEVAHRFNI